MAKGLWDDIPLSNKARDKSWEAFIKRKNVKQFFQNHGEDGFVFPLEQGWYELWCLTWDKAWTEGFNDGLVMGERNAKEKL